MIENLYLRNASPGHSNAPPGETFRINIYKTANAVIRDTEIDGRALNNMRTCASPIGWNNVENDTSTVNVQRVYTHHGRTGMRTSRMTTNLITVGRLHLLLALRDRLDEWIGNQSRTVRRPDSTYPPTSLRELKQVNRPGGRRVWA